MRDEEKPYVAVRNGWMVQITPRNAAGWRGLGAWLLALMVMTGGFVAVVSTEPGETVVLAITVLFLLVTVGWCILMIRWMMARSEIVDMKDLEAIKRGNKNHRNR